MISKEKVLALAERMEADSESGYPCDKDAAAALRQLVEERDKLTMRAYELTVLRKQCAREERLLRAGWYPTMRKSNSQGELYRWTHGKKYSADWVEHRDRAEAARMAEEKMHG